MTRTLLTLAGLLAACSTHATAPQPAPATTTSDADLALVVRRLSVQHPSDDCDALVAELGQPREALKRAVEEISMPPWVGMISGQCLARRFAIDEEATLKAWLTDPERAGLARAVVRELPRIQDEAVVLRIGAAALITEHAALTRQVLGADPRPAVATLAATP